MRAITVRAILVVGLSLAASACASSKDGATTGDDSNFTSSQWEKVLECEGGTVVVDVDATDRRHLQVVIRREAAFAVLDRTITYAQVQTANERIYRADSPFGVLDPSTFRHLRKYDVVKNSSGQIPGFEAIREGASSLRMRGLDLANPGCEPTSLHTSPPDDFYPRACEVTSYVFNGCH